MIDTGTEIDVAEANGVAIKQIMCPHAGSTIWQHIHDYDHLSLLAVGSVEVWIDGAHVGNVTAPEPMNIRAGVAHKFVTLTPGVVIYCIHNIKKGPIGYQIHPELQEAI